MSKLITYAYMKAETDISSAIEDSKLDNPIKRAQERVRALLGESLYNLLLTQNATTPTSFDAENTLLMPYVREFIAWQAYEIYLSKATTAQTRIGLRTLKEDNSDPISEKVLGDQLSLAKQDVQLKKQAMLNFLISAQRASSSAYSTYVYDGSLTAGNGFGITAISKEDTVNFKINEAIRTNDA